MLQELLNRISNCNQGKNVFLWWKSAFLLSKETSSSWASFKLWIEKTSTLFAICYILMVVSTKDSSSPFLGDGCLPTFSPKITSPKYFNEKCNNRKPSTPRACLTMLLFYEKKRRSQTHGSLASPGKHFSRLLFL